MGTITIIWIILAIVFALIEGITLSLTTIWFSKSAAIMCFISLCNIPIIYQIVIFLILSALFMFVARPIVKKRFINKIEEVNSIIGKKGKIISKTPLRVEIDGMDWKATSEEDLEVDTNIIVKGINGVTLTVKEEKG